MQCEKQNTAEPTIILKTPTKHICSSEKHWQHKSYSIKKLAANQRHMVIHLNTQLLIVRLTEK